jgi:DnaJ-class molecular chaperone
MDHYARLGVDRTADHDTIRKAYKKLAMKHHPDRGGDTSLFQEISAAYDVLGDANKRAQYDAELAGGFNPFMQGGGPGQGWHDVSSMFGGHGNPFEQFFRGAQRAQAQRHRNRDLNIRCTVTLKQSYTGTDLEASFNLPSGKKETVAITVPAGIESGQMIRYQGLGDDSIAQLPRGHLNVTIIVSPDSKFERRGLDLVSFVTINPIEAMVGCTKVIDTLSDTKIRINLRPGLQHGAEFLHTGLGFRNLHSDIEGNLIVHVRIEVPAVTDEAIKTKLEEIYAEINTSSEPNT